MNVGESGNIFVEKAHPAYTHVIDFLISCCEPVSRTEHVEQYRIDSSSLSAATAEGTYSLEMIEVVLRHFRLNAAQELPIDLERCAALEQLATALDEADIDADAVDGGSAPAAPASLSSPSRTFAAHNPLPACLAGVDLTGTSLAQLYECAAATQGGASPCTPQPPGTTEPTMAKRVKVEPAEEGMPRRRAGNRVLQLLRPSSPTPTPTAAAAAGSAPGRRPLISLAVVRPADVLHPLPVAVTQMLREEEGASRVQIVLQPRLRRFHAFEASRSHGAKGDADAAADARLFYFVQSRHRAHLELVLPALKEFLEPVVLYGAERWILSDVDRSPMTAQRGVGEAERLARDAGRPAVLRLLYQPPPSTGGTGAAAAAAAATAAAPSSAVGASRFIYKCQVRDGRLREVKARLFAQFNIRADCYYDYLQDRTLNVPNLNLASHVRLRPYQVASLERFRRGHKAHQGVIVLPCGAGKTLTGIGAATTMQATTIVMCVNNMSVYQWRREFVRWTDLTEAEVTVCTAKVKQQPGKVFITTYNMVIAKRGHTDGAAAEESRAILKAMTSQPWGLLLLDEVHTALAHHFQEVLNTIQYKCVLGLSATLLREDDKIGDLRHLVGPKLYEANWLDLTRAGFLAKVECAEVQCPMPPSFLQEYRGLQRTSALIGARARRGRGRGRPRRRDESVFDEDNNSTVDDGDEDSPAAPRRRGRRRAADGSGDATSRALRLASCNPYKLWCTQALLAFHQQRSPPDKVIIFCDYLADVRFFAHHLHLPFMDQRTGEVERTNLLQYFQHSSDVNAIILTRVGDVALDLPCASVVIQVSGLGASRRQEAQRLGRILRPKPPSLDNTCAYFYSLVSQDTADIRTSYKRQSWLRDQGFAYRILHSDRVLGEFVRVGGQPCCVGAPQWWYETHTAAPAPAAQSTSTISTTTTAVQCEGQYWAPFSPDAASLIESAFQHGREGCTLTATDLGPGTARPAAAELDRYPLRSSESWCVTFSSTDAPQTFGIVLIGEAPASSPLRERRVRRGCLDPAHRCATAPDNRCFAFAQSVVTRPRGHHDHDAGVYEEHE